MSLEHIVEVGYNARATGLPAAPWYHPEVREAVGSGQPGDRSMVEVAGAFRRGWMKQEAEELADLQEYLAT